MVKRRRLGGERASKKDRTKSVAGYGVNEWYLRSVAGYIGKVATGC
jgi:hypothetical protein